MFGSQFQGFKEEVEPDELPVPMQSDMKTDIAKFHSKKGKAALESAGAKYQFQIMLAICIPLDQIDLFADPYYWVKIFPWMGKQHLSEFGPRMTGGGLL
jgi:leucyl-tRNA synthetase